MGAKDATRKTGIELLGDAFALCKDNDLPINVINVNEPGVVARVLQGEHVGTMVR